MRTLVPFAADRPKTRLSGVLSPPERATFARLLLTAVCETLRAAGREPTVLSTASLDAEGPELPPSTRVIVDDAPLSTAINRQLRAGEIDAADPAEVDTDAPTLVLMADLPLVRAADIDRLVGTAGDVVIAPGLGGGTNALVVRHSAFRVDYHGASYLDHRRIAADAGLSIDTVDSRRLATDIDEPADLAELLIHGEGPACDWLLEAGFELAVDDGRVGVSRTAIGGETGRCQPDRDRR